MTNPEPDEPRPPSRLLEKPPLDMLGIDELAAYIAALEAEIQRVRAVIAAKEAHKNAAASFFKPPPASS